MKALFFLISAFLVVFFLGCQENSITDPGTIDDNVVTEQSAQQLASKGLTIYYPEVIDIDEIIFDPTHPRNGGDRAKGIIRYDHQLIPVYSTPDNQRYSVRMKLFVNLQIDARCPLQEDCMKVKEFTTETVNFSGISGNAKTIVKKVFRVSDVCCGRMYMILRFKVDKDNLSLLSMQLKKVGGLHFNGDPI